MRSIFQFALAGCLSLAVVGCGGGPDDEPTLAPVGGTVTVDGKPKGGITVELHPAAGTTGPMSAAVTADDGSFLLATSTGRAGAVVGDHVVLIKCPWKLTGRASQHAHKTADGVGSSSSGAPPPETTAPKQEEECKILGKYENPLQTPLKATIPAEGVKDLLLQATTK